MAYIDRCYLLRYLDGDVIKFCRKEDAVIMLCGIYNNSLNITGLSKNGKEHETCILKTDVKVFKKIKRERGGEGGSKNKFEI